MKACKIISMTEPLIWQYSKKCYLCKMVALFREENIRLKASDNHDLITQMRATSGYGEATNHEYMKNYCRRAVEYYNHDIRFTSEDDFIADLVTNRHIVIIEMQANFCF